MFDYITYTTVEGPRQAHQVEVYALSTCGFCKRALEFLKNQGISHRYVHVDLLPLEVKNQIKEALRSQFNQAVSFPFLVIDGKKALVGFVEAEWRKALLEA
jgi:glutaredoxin